MILITLIINITIVISIITGSLYALRFFRDFSSIIVIRNGKTVWKYGPKRPFYALMSRTKPY